MARKSTYGNESISALKGADRVRKRPGVIFGSDGLEGCEHAVFEILSNAIDEAREGHGSLITVTRYADRSIRGGGSGPRLPGGLERKGGAVQLGAGVLRAVRRRQIRQQHGDNYEYSLGLNGLGSCATQYASRYMDVTVWRDGKEYSLHFERGENVGGLQDSPRRPQKDRHHASAGCPIWTCSPTSTSRGLLPDVMKRQAVVNAGVTFRLRDQQGKFRDGGLLYENGIRDYVAELAGEDALTAPVFWEAERRGRDRADKPEYKVKLAWRCASPTKQRHRVLPQLLLAGARRQPGKGGQVRLGVRHRQVPARQQSKYQQEREQDHLPRRAGLPGAGVQQLLHPDQLREPDEKGHHQQVHPGGHDGVPPQPAGDLLHRKPVDAEKIAEQVLINKRSRETRKRPA